MNFIEKAMKGKAPQSEAPASPSMIVAAVATAGTERPRTPGSIPGTATAERESVEKVRFSHLVQNGFFGPESDTPRLLAEIRHLKRSIIRGAFAAEAGITANIVAVTSALPEAGKTYLAASLAQALTLERDRSAVLIDGDDVRCTLTKALSQFGRRGLFDVLHDSSLEPANVILPTDLASLDFMPCGGRFPDSLELLTSKRALGVVETLARADSSRLVIIDCPPLLGTPNGAALASLAGQVLVVVEAGVTDSTTLSKALELVGRDRPVALVINKVPRSGLLSSRVGSYYYYGARE